MACLRGNFVHLASLGTLALCLDHGGAIGEEARCSPGGCFSGLSTHTLNRWLRGQVSTFVRGQALAWKLSMRLLFTWRLCALGDFKTEFAFGKTAGGKARCSPGAWFRVKATSALPLLKSGGGGHQHDKAALGPLMRKAG